MTREVIRPVEREPARRFVAEHHSHHRAHVGQVLALGEWSGRELTAVVVAGRPVAPALCDGATWEITRLCIGPRARRYAASRLLGRMGRVMDASGVTLGVSYTRVDERGGCYLAAGWIPVAVVSGREHTTGNRATRWLPGLYEPSTEVTDRVRWERGSRARPVGCVWDGSEWHANP